MTVLAYSALAIAAALAFYYYAGYPVALRVAAALSPERPEPPPTRDWPLISITVPLHNEAHQVRELIESLLAIDYPVDRRQILLVSDASSDGTDEIVAEYADRGVELLRLPARRGKTGAENAARPLLRGDIIINTDASVRVHPAAVTALVRHFADPSVGVASGRDVSVGAAEADRNAGESSYVGHEMRIRDLETRVAGIVGASGCLYAVRRQLHGLPLPEALSRDLAIVLFARERGLRAVSVPDAICYVPRAGSLRREYRRKVRTMAQGMQTIRYRAHLLNPARHGLFSWMLFSHKVCRWLVPWAALAALGGLAALAPGFWWARGAVAGAALVIAAGSAGWAWPEEKPVPAPLAIPAYLLVIFVATCHATINTFRGTAHTVWEPTRRQAATTGTRAGQPEA